MSRLKRPISDPIYDEIERPIDVDSNPLPENQYFTDDNKQNPYYTDDNKQNNYVAVDP